MSRGANGCRSIASSIGTTTGASSSSSPGIDLGEEPDHGRGEGIVPVAGDHVTGARDVDVARVRHDVEKRARTVRAHHVALATTDEQRWNLQAARCRLEALGILRGAHA